MKATTFVERQHIRTTELVALLEGERHLRAPMVHQLARELDAMLSLEEELFLPLVTPFATARERVAARVTTDGVHAALLDVVTANGEAAFDEGLVALRENLRQHAAAMRPLLDAADARVEPARLQELGVQMARFESDALTAADRERGPEVSRTVPVPAFVAARAIVA